MTLWPVEDLPLEKLYGVTVGYIDNAIITEFESGRKTSTQRNTAPRRVYSMAYAATKEQNEIFFSWFENELGGNAGTFLAPSLRGNGELQEYRMQDTPTSAGQNLRDIAFTWEEV